MNPFVVTHRHRPDEPLLVLAVLPGADEVAMEALAVCVEPNGEMSVEPVSQLTVRMRNPDWPDHDGYRSVEWRLLKEPAEA